MNEYDFKDGAGTISLSENQFNLLKEVVHERGSAKISLFTAKKHYSGKNSAIDGVNALRGKDIVESHTEGQWKITNLPKELHDKWVKNNE